MDSSAFTISATAILSPFLIAGGILYLLSTAHLAGSAVFLNTMAVITGGLRLGLDLPGYSGGFLTVLLAFFLIFAIAANVRLITRPRSLRPTSGSGSKIRSKRGKKKVSKPQVVVPVPIPAKQSLPTGGTSRIRVLSPTSWLVLNEWGDVRVFTVPESLIERNKKLKDSDRKFRIVCDDNREVIEDTFSISPFLQILLPPDFTDILQTSEKIRFEILG